MTSLAVAAADAWLAAGGFWSSTVIVGSSLDYEIQ
jgi:hypothetical protein